MFYRLPFVLAVYRLPSVLVFTGYRLRFFISDWIPISDPAVSWTAPRACVCDTAGVKPRHRFIV